MLLIFGRFMQMQTCRKAPDNQIIKGGDKSCCSTATTTAVKHRTNDKNATESRLVQNKVGSVYCQSFFQLKWFSCSSFANQDRRLAVEVWIRLLQILWRFSTELKRFDHIDLFAFL